MGAANENTKKVKSKIWIWILVIIIIVPILVLIVPRYFDGVFRTLYNRRIPWKPSDSLLFYGSCLSLIGTLFLGIIAIYQNIKANKMNADLLALTKQSERNSVLPFMVFSVYHTLFEGNAFVSMAALAFDSDDSDDKQQQENPKTVPLEYNLKRHEVQLDEIFIVISDKELHIVNKLDETQQKRIQNFAGIKKTKTGTSIGAPDHAYKLVLVRNCGRGAAINVQYCIERVNADDKTIQEKISRPFSMSLDSKFNLGIFFDLEQPFNGKFRFEVKYSDVFNNQYRQQIPIELSANDKLILDFSRSQEIINYASNC